MWRVLHGKFSKYKQQRIVTLWHGSFKALTIAKILANENLLATIQGVQTFLKKYTEIGIIGRKEVSGNKSKITCEVRSLENEKSIF